MNVSPSKTALIPEESHEAIRAAVEFVGTLTGVTIETPEQFDNAAELLKTVAKVKKNLDADRKKIGEPHYAAYKEINDEYNPVIKQLENGEKVLKQAVATYTAEQQRIQAEKQRLLEIEAEQKRLAAEAKADTERQKAEAYREQGREDLAAKAEARADAAEEKAMNTVADAVEDTTKTAGISYRTDYDLEITDLTLAVKTCIDNPMLAHLVTVNLAELKAIIKAAKGKITVPGIKVTEKKSVAVRS